jgi:hypothetical protein
MTKKQKIFYLILLIIWLLLMIWEFSIGEYKGIIKSIFILAGSFIMGIIYAKLGGK